MDNSDKARFGLLLAMLGETFDKEINQSRLEAYWLGLSDLTLEQMKSATQAALRHCKFFPSPAELRQLAGVGTGDDAAFKAFAVVLKAIDRLGPWKHVDFSDRFINATIRNLGGWPTFIARFNCGESEKWARQEFCKAYSAFALSGVDGESCKPLPGLAEASVVDGRLTSPRVQSIGANGNIKIADSRTNIRIAQTGT